MTHRPHDWANPFEAGIVAGLKVPPGHPAAEVALRAMDRGVHLEREAEVEQLRAELREAQQALFVAGVDCGKMAKRYEAMLAERDTFITERGLWEEFAGPPSVRED